MAPRVTSCRQKRLVGSSGRFPLLVHLRHRQMTAADSNRKSKMSVFSCTLLANFKSNPPDQASSLHASVVQFELRTLGFGQGVDDRQTEAGAGRLG